MFEAINIKKINNVIIDFSLSINNKQELDVKNFVKFKYFHHLLIENKNKIIASYALLHKLFDIFFNNFI